MSDEIEMSPLQAKAYAAAYQRFAAQLQAEQKITIRQQAVLMAMQGILSRDDTDVERNAALSEVAKAAIFVADETLRLEQETRG